MSKYLSSAMIICLPSNVCISYLMCFLVVTKVPMWYLIFKGCTKSRKFEEGIKIFELFITFQEYDEKILNKNGMNTLSTRNILIYWKYCALSNLPRYIYTLKLWLMKISIKMKLVAYEVGHPKFGQLEISNFQGAWQENGPSEYDLTKVGVSNLFCHKLFMFNN